MNREFVTKIGIIWRKARRVVCEIKNIKYFSLYIYKNISKFIEIAKIAIIFPDAHIATGDAKIWVLGRYNLGEQPGGARTSSNAQIQRIDWEKWGWRKWERNVCVDASVVRNIFSSNLCYDTGNLIRGTGNLSNDSLIRRSTIRKNKDAKIEWRFKKKEKEKKEKNEERFPLDGFPMHT